mmetsp:Transcript_43120/g.127788  ORF Transcript_43120/g.127788 Transcript_43120/m.127788 type:complete len:306 (-) Transcript_43120:75-992(-)
MLRSTSRHLSGRPDDLAALRIGLEFADTLLSGGGKDAWTPGSEAEIYKVQLPGSRPATPVHLKADPRHLAGDLLTEGLAGEEAAALALERAAARRCEEAERQHHEERRLVPASGCGDAGASHVAAILSSQRSRLEWEESVAAARDEPSLLSDEAASMSIQFKLHDFCSKLTPSEEQMANQMQSERLLQSEAKEGRPEKCEAEESQAYKEEEERRQGRCGRRVSLRLGKFSSKYSTNDKTSSDGDESTESARTGRSDSHDEGAWPSSPEQHPSHELHVLQQQLRAATHQAANIAPSLAVARDRQQW